MSKQRTFLPDYKKIYLLPVLCIAMQCHSSTPTAMEPSLSEEKEIPETFAANIIKRITTPIRSCLNVIEDYTCDFCDVLTEDSLPSGPLCPVDRTQWWDWGYYTASQAEVSKKIQDILPAIRAHYDGNVPSDDPLASAIVSPVSIPIEEGYIVLPDKTKFSWEKLIQRKPNGGRNDLMVVALQKHVFAISDGLKVVIWDSTRAFRPCLKVIKSVQRKCRGLGNLFGAISNQWVYDRIFRTCYDIRMNLYLGDKEDTKSTLLLSQCTGGFHGKRFGAMQDFSVKNRPKEDKGRREILEVLLAQPGMLSEIAELIMEFDDEYLALEKGTLISCTDQLLYNEFLSLPMCMFVYILIYCIVNPFSSSAFNIQTHGIMLANYYADSRNIFQFGLIQLVFFYYALLYH